MLAVGAALLRFGLSSAGAQPASASTALKSVVARVEACSAPAVRGLTERAEAAATQKRRDEILAAHIRAMPDLTQTDPELGVDGGGESWCGPAAVSNALMWLAEQGRETLVPAAADPRARQLELVRLLGSGRFMGTTATGGTGTANLLVGLERYLRSTGWSYRRLEYQGWRGHPYRFSTRVKVPSLDFIREALEQGGVAVIHAGWYAPVRWHRAHRRHGGHWLTVTGVGIDAEGRAVPGGLVLNDPAPYAGMEPRRHFVRLEELETGWLLAEDGAFPAKGYSRLSGGMLLKRQGDIAVLDGVVVLVP